jgi:nocardicin N-oxygenase
MTEPVDLTFPPPAPCPYEPAPAFAELRPQCPVAKVGLPTGDVAWLVTRYADNQRLLSDGTFSRAAAAAPGAPRARPIPLETRSIMTMDPPDHTRLRRLVQRAFTGRRVSGMRPGIEATVGRLLDAMADAGPPADLVAGLAQPLPLAVIGELLGVPATDHADFGGWSEAYLSTSGRSPAEVAEASAHLREYLWKLVADKRREPSEDLLSDLAAARDDDRLDDEELVTLGVTLLVAGFETVASHLAGFVVALLRHPEQWRSLCERPDLLRSAVEELLRYTPVAATGGTIRVSLADVELGGQEVLAGEAVLPALTSANRDPAVFSAPDELDLRRTPNPHLAFGYGLHRCLGAELARAQLQIALGALVTRFPGLRLAVPLEELTWPAGRMLRYPRPLPVAW